MPPTPIKSGTLHDQLAHVARAPTLLVACDYDGTLAPIADNPEQALPVHASVVALRELVKLPATHVAIISGRGLSDLRALLTLPPAVHMVGSHGAEFDLNLAGSLSPRESSLRAELLDALTPIALSSPGLRLETKPVAVALHYRLASPAHAGAARDAVLSGPARLPGVHTQEGKCVIELSVVKTSKALALSALRRRLGPSHVLYLGDDRTDEDAFACLNSSDLGVKVGEGPTAASHRVSTPLLVALLLSDLAAQRAAHAPALRA